MAEVDAGDELLEEEAGGVFRQVPGPAHILEELAARGILHDGDQVRRRHEHLVEFYDVGVDQQPVIQYLLRILWGVISKQPCRQQRMCMSQPCADAC